MRRLERQPWLSPLTCLYWYLDAMALAHSKLSHDAVLQSESVGEVASAIQTARQRARVRPRESIPP